MAVNAIKREGRPGTTFHETYRERMSLIDDLPVAEALRTGMAFRCPSCAVIHPGIRYVHPDMQDFCSSDCLSKSRLEGIQ